MAVVSDPPYGIGYARGRGGKGKQRHRSGLNDERPLVGDDRPFDPEPWLAYPAILWGANHYAPRLPHGRWLAWNKLGTMEPWDNFSDVEFAWQNRRAADRIFSLLWKGLAQGEKEGNGERWHPTQKPVSLMKWCIGHVEDTRSTILDPYMGSGTTGVAAVRLGRKFVGVEIDPAFFEVAVRRIGDAIRQPDLFAAEAPSSSAAQQLSLLGAAE